MPEYISYVRVSTARQGASGLGLYAQREAIQKFLRTGDTLAAEYTEVESGKCTKNRPQLEAAEKARAAHYPNPPKPEVVKLITDWCKDGRSYRGITIDLNRLGILTPQKCQWYAETVKRILRRLSLPCTEILNTFSPAKSNDKSEGFNKSVDVHAQKRPQAMELRVARPLAPELRTTPNAPVCPRRIEYAI